VEQDGEHRLERRFAGADALSGHDPADYVTGRIMAKAPDGEAVPVSLLHHKDTPLDGSAPLLLYGYGSYGHAIDAYFTTTRLSLVDRGFVYAIAHIRGGTDRGYGWYLDGKMSKKMNTFTDFIAAGEGLIAANYTRAGQIVAHGGSAGGLLVGAAVNMRPDLFAAIVAEVPFVDVINTICDASLPLTPPEWDEWGNPIEGTGFLAPVVLAEKCIGCGLCQTRCYAVNAKEKKLLKETAIRVEAGEGKEDRLTHGSYIDLRALEEQHRIEEQQKRIEESGADGGYLPEFLD